MQKIAKKAQHMDFKIIKIKNKSKPKTKIKTKSKTKIKNYTFINYK